MSVEGRRDTLVVQWAFRAIRVPSSFEFHACTQLCSVAQHLRLAGGSNAGDSTAQVSALARSTGGFCAAIHLEKHVGVEHQYEIWLNCSKAG